MLKQRTLNNAFSATGVTAHSGEKAEITLRPAPVNTGYWDNHVQCTITDNDAEPTISINDVTVAEDAGTAQFTVTLSAASEKTVTVDYATSNDTATGGNDFRSKERTVGT